MKLINLWPLHSKTNWPLDVSLTELRNENQMTSQEETLKGSAC